MGWSCAPHLQELCAPHTFKLCPPLTIKSYAWSLPGSVTPLELLGILPGTPFKDVYHSRGGSVSIYNLCFSVQWWEKRHINSARLIPPPCPPNLQKGFLTAWVKERVVLFTFYVWKDSSMHRGVLSLHVS